MQQKPSEDWTTAKEIQFLTDLQAKAKRGGEKGIKAAQALQGYRDNFMSRTKWGKINPRAVADFLGLKPNTGGG